MTSPQDSRLAAHFGPLELAVLEACWSSPPLDVAECCRLVDGPQAYTTVKTVMERLVAKGHLRRRKESRAYVYWPAATREEVADSLAAASSQRLVEDFGPLAVVHFVDAVKGDPEQLAHLKALLDRIAADEERR
ncbi:BlaI/MecI/CopY family transcriptional regulator [Quadrisphaera setariae]|uniref:BlaI/MecI/CopY family transcriptional regulator n=1 Tax=Quadrisphaera setariae TaxID=2593304 RepID=A0A5C8ZG15_9ACTN|nr:BlaI/MecI/CopY family transcriptional regulator [Quadrisphaera setariae]TXR56985.1 BlaI/MecI/CopY family transcriptional regulator [Quadrisphaera setariae]